MLIDQKKAGVTGDERFTADLACYREAQVLTDMRGK